MADFIIRHFVYNERNKMAKVIFDETNHVYTEIETGEVVKSVTQILKEIGFGPQNGFKSDAMNKAADRGNRIHKLYNNFIVFGEETEDKEDEKYLNVLKEVIAIKELQSVNGEYQVFGKILETKIAGTVDYKAIKDGKKIIIDFKTTKKIEKYHAYQLALYAKLDEDEIEDAYILQVTPNGSYVFMSAEDIAPGCFSAVEEMVMAYEAKQKFEDFQPLIVNADVEKYVELSGKIETLKTELDSCSNRIKKMVNRGSAKCDKIEVTYRRPTVKDSFDEDGFVESIDPDSTYTGAEIKELIEMFHTLEVSAAGSFSIKVVKLKKVKDEKKA